MKPLYHEVKQSVSGTGCAARPFMRFFITVHLEKRKGYAGQAQE